MKNRCFFHNWKLEGFAEEPKSDFNIKFRYKCSKCRLIKIRIIESDLKSTEEEWNFIKDNWHKEINNLSSELRELRGDKY